jgi:hypothetical protein
MYGSRYFPDAQPAYTKTPEELAEMYSEPLGNFMESARRTMNVADDANRDTIERLSRMLLPRELRVIQGGKHERP